MEQKWDLGFFGGRFVSAMGFVLVLLQKGRIGIYPGCDVFPSPLTTGKKAWTFYCETALREGKLGVMRTRAKCPFAGYNGIILFIKWQIISMLESILLFPSRETMGTIHANTKENTSEGRESSRGSV